MRHPLTRFASQIDLSPTGRGEVTRWQVDSIKSHPALARPLRTKTQNEGGQPHEIEIAQAEAWLEICALSKSLDTESETDPEVWSRAINRTEDWRNILT
jgi:hypothetical protein